MQFPAPTGSGSDRLRLRLTACQTQINGSKYFQILESSYHFYFSIFNTMHDRTIYGEYYVNRLILFCSSLLQYVESVVECESPHSLYSKCTPKRQSFSSTEFFSGSGRFPQMFFTHIKWFTIKDWIIEEV